MPGRLSHSLAYRMTLAVLTVSLALSAVSAVGLFVRQYHEAVAAVEQDLERLGRVNVPSISASLWVMDLQQLQIHLDALRTLHHIAQVKIVVKGQVVAAAGAASPGRAIDRTYPLSYTSGGRTMSLGTLLVQASLAGISQDLFSKMYVRLAIQTAQIFLVAVFILFFLRALVTRRLAALESHLSGLDAGRLAAAPVALPRAPVFSGEDELDRVAYTVNAMGVNLRAAFHELEMQKENLAVTLRSIGDGVITTDTRGRVTLMNAVAENYTGWTQENAAGKPLAEVFTIINEATRARHDNPVDLVLRTGGIVELANHTVLVRRDGSEIVIADSAAPIRERGGEIIGVVLVFRDITERQRLEAERERLALAVQESGEFLKRQNGLFASLLKNLPVGVFMVEAPSGKPLVANEAACNLLGRGILPDATRENLAAVYAAFKQGSGAPYPPEEMPVMLGMGGATSHVDDMVVVRPDGTTTLLEIFGSPVKDDQGRVWASLVSFIDITERKQLEAQLEKSRRLLAETEKIGKVGGWEFDIDSGLQTWTEEIYRIHEVDLDFVPTVANGVAFYAPASRPIIEEAVRRTLADGEPFDVELEIITARGNRRNVHSVGRADRERQRVYGFFQDITERCRAIEEQARLEGQLRQSQKVEAIGRLAGGVAHDFNNLTAIVLGYGEMLLSRLGPADPARKWAEQIVEAGRRSAALTRQLLAFSRKQTLQLEVLDLNGLIRNFESLLARLIGEDVTLEFKLAAAPGRVLADPGQLEQVVTNLALNSRDAMPLGGKLTVETADVEIDAAYAQGRDDVVPGRYVLLALTDTGCGMDKACLARLFEPFFTTKERGKGTGLGLATAYGIVKQSGGHIAAYSEPGVGTTFKIYLPRTEAQAPAKVLETGEQAQQGGGELVLLVEDEAPLRELCAAILAQLGYRVRAAASGPEALSLLEKERLEPDLVITDVIMPGMSGAELAQRLLRDRPDLKILYMSGYPDEAIARHGVLEPGTHFIQKPFTERVLAKKLRETLRGGAAAPPHRRVLMIDDDEQFRELVRHFCTKRGYAFAGVDSAAAALAALAQQSFDVLLVDLNIPGTSGERVLREIRAAGHAAPAIVLTGDVTAADMNVLRPLGVVQSLEKSSDAEPLLQAIAAAAPGKEAHGKIS